MTRRIRIRRHRSGLWWVQPPFGRPTAFTVWTDAMRYAWWLIRHHHADAS